MTVAEELRDDGIARALRAADETWKRACTDAIVHVAERRDEFTTDAVWTILERREVGPPKEPRAIAGVVRAAVKAGVCEATGRRVNSVLPRGHARPVMVYRSLLRQTAS
jgi:hypothetical protein